AWSGKVSVELKGSGNFKDKMATASQDYKALSSEERKKFCTPLTIDEKRKKALRGIRKNFELLEDCGGRACAVVSFLDGQPFRSFETSEEAGIVAESGIADIMAKRASVPSEVNDCVPNLRKQVSAMLRKKYRQGKGKGKYRTCDSDAGQWINWPVDVPKGVPVNLLRKEPLQRLLESRRELNFVAAAGIRRNSNNSPGATGPASTSAAAIGPAKDTISKQSGSSCVVVYHNGDSQQKGFRIVMRHPE
ncbi:hypothetical protein BOX15_Mlig022106g1, partial [Macrostomum lignano]